MIKELLDGNAAEFQRKFNSLVEERIGDLIEEKRKVVMESFRDAVAIGAAKGARRGAVTGAVLGGAAGGFAGGAIGGGHGAVHGAQHGTGRGAVAGTLAGAAIGGAVGGGVHLAKAAHAKYKELKAKREAQKLAQSRQINKVKGK